MRNFIVILVILSVASNIIANLNRGDPLSVKLWNIGLYDVYEGFEKVVIWENNEVSIIKSLYRKKTRRAGIERIKIIAIYHLTESAINRLKSTCLDERGWFKLSDDALEENHTAEIPKGLKERYSYSDYYGQVNYPMKHEPEFAFQLEPNRTKKITESHNASSVALKILLVVSVPFDLLGAPMIIYWKIRDFNRAFGV